MRDIQKEKKLQDTHLDFVIREKFSSHRGDHNSVNGVPENSFQAIKNAISCGVVFVEFDVQCVDGIIRMGHPPQVLPDTLEKVVKLFEGVRPYPKIDIKLLCDNNEQIKDVVDNVFDIINKTALPFILVTISSCKQDVQEIMETEIYVANKIASSPSIKLNIDPARYRPQGGDIGDDVYQHVQKIKNVLHSVSPEIHREDMESMAQFAEKNSIGSVVFYLTEFPDVKYPKIREETIRKALGLEEQYSIKVFFDINPSYIEKEEDVCDL